MTPTESNRENSTESKTKFTIATIITISLLISIISLFHSTNNITVNTHRMNDSTDDNYQHGVKPDSFDSFHWLYNDSVNRENPMDTPNESDVEFTNEYPYYVPEIVENYPHLFSVNNIPKFLNHDHYNYIHCPYSAEFIPDSSPPTFHLKCKHDTSQLGWPGRCIQTYENIQGLIPNEPNSTVRIHKNCIYSYL